jgi:hypothetical protein
MHASDRTPEADPADLGYQSERGESLCGLVLNAGEDSPRYSHDFDIFHEAEAEVARASDLDVHSLRSAGYEVHQTGGDWKNPVRHARLRGYR